MVSITRSRRDACSRTGSVGKPFMPDGNLFSLPPIRHASSASVHPLKGKAHHENGQWLREARQCWRLRHLRAIHIRQPRADRKRSEEHTSELQSLMRISYAVFCWKKKKKR